MHLKVCISLKPRPPTWQVRILLLNQQCLSERLAMYLDSLFNFFLMQSFEYCCCLVAELCLALCDPMDCWIEPTSPALAGGIFTMIHQGSPLNVSCILRCVSLRSAGWPFLCGLDVEEPSSGGGGWTPSPSSGNGPLAARHSALSLLMGYSETWLQALAPWK